jgi:bifunctional non-homologous end joining protein LigD
MLATLADGPFDRAGWLFEVKWDGYRAIAEVKRGRVRLYSRSGLGFEHRFPPIALSLAHLKHDAVLDGEIVALDEQGHSSFQLLQNYQRTGKGALAYCVFDLLEVDGEDLRARPLLERKTRLAKLVRGLDFVQVSEHVLRTGKPFFAAVVKHGLEGIVAKRSDSPYQEGRRTMDWLKIKVRHRQEAVIAGFTAPRGSRHALGALVLGVYRDGDLVYVGHTGTGFSDRALEEMRTRLTPLVVAECPFRKPPKTNMPVRWVKPVLVCEVDFQEWTEDGYMRQPVFLGLREDKPAPSVHREDPVRGTL